MIEVKNKIVYLTRGDSGELDLNVKVKQTGQPYDYSNDLTQFTVKTDTKTKNIVIQKTFEGSSVKFDPEDTEGLEYGTYKYDVQLITPGGDVHTVIKPKDFVIGEEVNYNVSRT